MCLLVQSKEIDKRRLQHIDDAETINLGEDEAIKDIGPIPKHNTVAIYKKTYTLRDLESEVTLEEDHKQGEF